MLAEVAAAAEVDPAAIPTAIDGCGVPTFALPLDRCAHAFARLPQLDGGDAGRSRDARAPRDAPRGPVAADVHAHPGARRLGREGRGGGSLLRLLARRSRGRAQGRGRRVPGHSPCTRARSRAARRRRASSVLEVTVANSDGWASALSSRTALVTDPVDVPQRIRVPNGASSRIGFAACKGSEPERRGPAHCVRGSVSELGSFTGFEDLSSSTAEKKGFMLSVEIALPDVEELHKLVEQGQEKGFPHLRRDRQRARGRRVDEGAARGVHHLRDRPLDRARRGRAAQARCRTSAVPVAPEEKSRRSSTSASSRRSTRCGSTCARSARCRCSPPIRRCRSRSGSSAATWPRSST